MVHCLLRGRDGGGRGDGNNWMGCNDGGEEGGRGGRLRMIDASIETRTCGEVG